MAMPAQKIAPEMFMEERVAKLETHIEHIQSDISELKVDVREIRGEIKEVRGEMQEIDRRLTSKIDSVKDSVAALALKTEQSFTALNVSRMADRVWWLLIAAGLLTVMARGFKWL